MARHHRFCLLLLAACAAGASAQPPELSHPAADPAPAAREPAKVSDAQLSLEVQVRLSQQLDVSNLSALARFGVVTLDGKVRSEADRQRAEELAREVPGVEGIANELTVAEPIVVALANEAAAVADRESTTIEIAVAAQLRSDPVLGSRAIRVVADDHTNTVTLTGTVSSEDEKEQAGRIAITAFPAGQVRNHIEVRQRL
jgi:hyperosmotically inducible periplasmic protein